MIKRDSDKGLTAEDAQNRLSSQFPIEKKLPYADTVLDNSDGAAQPLEQQVSQIVKRWTRQHKQGSGRLRTWLQWLVPPVGLVMAAWAVWSRSRRVSKKLKEQEKERRTG